MADLIPYAIGELLNLKVQVRSLSGQLESRTREVKFLHEVSLVLQTSTDVDEVIAMALTAVTANQGFGLNRAILLLVDKERQNLQGYFALGPRTLEDAGRIWKEIEAQGLTLREMARVFFEQKMAAEKEKFQDLLTLLSTPLRNTDHLFVRTLNEQVSCHIPNLAQEAGIDPAQVEALKVKEMVMVPLTSKSRRIGLLLADNIVNERPISSEDLHSLETFALPVAFALERAALYERLQQDLDRLTEAHRRLQEQQEQILRMEQMALVGKITSNIAHSIRNPLTIIGGFARTLIKTTPAGDAKRLYIESIVKEAKRLEEVLEEVLNYSESLHPTFDFWDINQLIAGVYAGLKDDIEMGDVECSLDFDASLPPVRVDHKKMAYCLKNILNNSLEVTPPGGRLTVRTLREGDEVHIVLTDTGPGISREILQAIEKPFFSTKEKGSGLGLTLCARILEEHGAHLDVRSNEGPGTTITIRLKLPDREGPQNPSTHAQT